MNQPIITVELCGGFGNQLFQFCNAINIALDNDTLIEFKMVDRKRKFGLERLGINESLLYRPKISNFEELHVIHQDNYRKSAGTCLFQEKKFTYQAPPKISRDTRIVGYFQTPKYFVKYNSHLVNYLRSKLEISQHSHSNDELVAHIRLGDMAHNHSTRAFHGIVSEEYLLQARNLLGSDGPLTIVSESIHDVKKFYPRFSKEARDIRNGSLLDDFRFLSKAKHLIISNSTFSWWAAYLSEAHVVAPTQWFSPEVLSRLSTADLFPESWSIL
jgi:hypothetical protein